MLDTQTADELPVGISGDTQLGSYPLLRGAAVERAKTKLGIEDLNTLAGALGFSRQSFWRVRRGEFDIPLSHSLRIARLLGWPLGRCFDNLDGGDRG